MNLKQTRLQVLHKPENLDNRAKTGVSLHCHTLHSKEILDFIPYYAERIPVLKHIWQRECRRQLKKEGKLPSFTTGYWEPPLTGEQVFASEKEQMNSAGVEAIVSITDHDCIDATLELNRQIPNTAVPISMEWTVPFEYAFFHVGVHNLPPEKAIEIKERLLDYTYNKEIQNNETLHEIFAMLDEMPGVLVVLNHPIWDIEMIGEELHLRLLDHFIARHGRWIHAVEINGFRSWSENKAAIELAEIHNFPLISGGDRHCCNQNTMINITDSKTFGEFVEEIRIDKHSRIVVMPDYHLPLEFRQVRSMSQILTNYPEFPEGRRRWIDRVSIDIEDGMGIQTLSYHWENGEPKWTGWLMRALSILSHSRLRPVYDLYVSREDRMAVQPALAKRAPHIGRNPLVIDG